MLTALLGLLWHLLAPLLRLLRLAAPEAAAPPRPAAMLRPPGPPRGAREVLPDSKWLWFPVDPAAGTDARGMPRFKHAPAGAALRLVVLPQAGAGAGVWERWLQPGALGPNVEVVVAELPGRGARPTERGFSRMGRAATALLDELAPLLVDKPYALLGHSMGAWLAYEMVQQARQRGVPLPLKLYVSANRAPHLYSIRHDVDPTPFSRLQHAQFWRAWDKRYGFIPGLDHEPTREYCYPLFRLDFEMIETYSPSSTAALPVPLCAMGGDEDNRYTKEQLAAWAQHTSAAFEERWMKGGHRYPVVPPTEAPAMAYFREEMAALAEKHT